jgi:hypothetical protein
MMLSRAGLQGKTNAYTTVETRRATSLHHRDRRGGV